MKTMTKQLFGGSLMVFASLAFTACGDVDNPLEGIVAPNSDNPITPTTTTITLNLVDKIFSNDKLFLLPGDAATNIATITEGAPVTITSSDENVITIDADGNVVPVGPGTATITIKVTENQQYTGVTETVTIVVGRKVSLADETGTEFVAQEGDQISGTAPNTMHLSIPDGVFVRLKDATIKPTTGAASAAIVCQGDATLFLEGESNVKASYKSKAGVQAGPEGSTLTIDGTGKLTIDSEGYNGAGIGGNISEACGSIVINNGTIVAKGGNGATIGSGSQGSCQDITIKGGTVNAETIIDNSSGGSPGAAIGSGANGVCGNITISGGTITAISTMKAGEWHNGSAGIGSALNGTCGNITITGGDVDATCSMNGTGTSSSGLYYGGPGIGCGDSSGGSSKCGDITITGGNVSAAGGNASAGIGVGRAKLGSLICGNITITGGVVYASRSNIGSPDDIGKGSYNNYTLGTVFVDPSVTWNGTKGYTATATGYKKSN